jgi:tRNA threonylcarbamoyladenosine biosynthesis protein TsaB
MVPSQTIPARLIDVPRASDFDAFRMLAFDTSTERLSVGLSGPGGLLSINAPGGAAASASLLPHIQALLQEAGQTMQEMDGVAFGRGPGAFTGLRTACAVAQGIGLALGLPLIPLDSLMIVAEDARRQCRPQGEDCEIAVMMDARMDEVYAGWYRWVGGSWQVLKAPGLYALPGLQETWGLRPPEIVAGSALAAFGERLQVPAGVHRQPEETDRAGALLQLALQAARLGQAVDAGDALPLYLRDKVAQTTHERAAARAMAGRAP